VCLAAAPADNQAPSQPPRRSPHLLAIRGHSHPLVPVADRRGDDPDGVRQRQRLRLGTDRLVGDRSFDHADGSGSTA